MWSVPVLTELEWNGDWERHYGEFTGETRPHRCSLMTSWAFRRSCYEATRIVLSGDQGARSKGSAKNNPGPL